MYDKWFNTFLQEPFSNPKTLNTFWTWTLQFHRLYTYYNISDYYFHPSGYYRVNYHLENWRLLILQLLQQHEKIHVLNRAQLIDDSIALAIDNHLPLYIPFELMTYLDAERDMIPWFSALNKLEYLYLLYETTEVGLLLKVRQKTNLHHLRSVPKEIPILNVCNPPSVAMPDLQKKNTKT